MTEKAMSLLGLCMRAGRLVSGEEPCVKAIRAGGARLVVIDGGASANAKKALTDACAYRSVPLLETEPGRLGAAVGKRNRMAVAVTDAGFAEAICRACAADTNEINHTRFIETRGCM